VKGFCEKTGASGQLCFDFMRDSSDGRMYAFECNPRTSTVFLNYYDHGHVAQAFFNAKVSIRPSATVSMPDTYCKTSQTDEEVPHSL